MMSSQISVKFSVANPLLLMEHILKLKETNMTELLSIIWMVFVWLCKMLNLVIFSLTGGSIITAIFGVSLTTALVKLAFFISNAPRGNTGFLLGKVYFWVLSFIVTILLNYVGSIIF